ncbi:glycosyltransferase 87 family protein [Streptomyces griseorubiginosus]|uniref:Polyprenol-phosphate-mannose-dependent alpha-(1-2)-phosphatidylinositol pentamannoside mannosyltransferase n=1 Tax=Streptomyces griseorubiginosus TaxID=67304 RepID=A0AAI8PSH6_9ACTN|nr:glycosyltransferase 87 family protein [Streptomyces griseorubiginosus]AYC43444.1 Polyprenol-phosphate-mannose-dependent alpha-(1-2)-phosphatidylinositol pentamannoside mannosyltransferase [Streptomyces griseorubiginosus]
MRAPGTDGGRLLLVLTLAAAVTAFTATVPLLRDWFDLRVYHGAVDTWIHHGGRLYDYRVPGTPYGFTYPPFAAVAMVPMALLGLRTAIAVGLLLNLAALALVVRLLTGRAWRRLGWYGCTLGACALALFEPLRDTFSFGQVNLLLLALVLVDARLLATGRGRLAGVGIGLAAAVKLTPALFIGLLLVTRRWRAAAVATVVALAATGFAAVVAPDASRFYWTDAMWDTTRVGRLDYVSNQSLQGILARLGETDRAVWAVAVLLTLCVWAVRARRAAAAQDWTAAFALTGLTACLVSPITWVHHLVWLLPSFAVLVRAGHPRIAGALYAVLCTSVVWLWFDDASGVDGFLGGNTYAWITLGLLLWLPVGQPRAARPNLALSARAIDPAPSPAAPRMAQVSSQPGPAAGGDTAAATGTAAGPGLGRTRSASKEPTGSTRPAAANPQSSSARASS